MASKRGWFEASSSDDSSGLSHSLRYPPPKKSSRRGEFSAVELLGEQEFRTVVAIDFGTTGTGMAICVDGELMSPDWELEGQLSTEIGKKVPSCALFDFNGDLLAFGEKAWHMANKCRSRDQCAAMTETHLFFEHYKMNLHQIGNGDELSTLEKYAANGRSMKMRDLLIGVMGYLKKRAVLCLKDTPESSIRWVITVPAIWSDAGKSMMRECAVLAGMGADDNVPAIILEPEAAAIAIHKEWAEEKSEEPRMKEGQRYMIVDCGGGTVDIVTHEWLGPFQVCEVIGPSGGPWGSTVIDKAMADLFSDIFGNDTIKKVKRNSPSVWSLLMRECIKAKEMFHRSGELKWCSINLPSEFITKLGRDKIHKPIVIDNGHIILIGSTLLISDSVFHYLSEFSVQKVTQHLTEMIEGNKEELLEGRKRLKRICLVGGFAESMYLERRVREAVNEVKGAGSVQVCVGVNPSNSVLNGAAKIEDIRRFLKRRVLKCTYGYRADWHLKDVKKWGVAIPEGRIYEGRWHGKRTKFVECCFIPIVQKGALVEPGYAIENEQILKLAPKSRMVEYCVYKSDTKEGPHLLPMDEELLQTCRLESLTAEEPLPEWFDFDNGTYKYIFEIGNEVQLQMKIKFVCGTHETTTDVRFFHIS